MTERCICGGAYSMCEDGHAINCPASQQRAAFERLSAPRHAGDDVYHRKAGWEDDGVIIRESDMAAAREITAKGRVGYGESIRAGTEFVERVEAVALGHALARAVAEPVMADGLLPCPICGAAPTRNGMVRARGVRCKGPGDGVSKMHLIQTYGADQDEADLAWNTRAALNLENARG